MIIGYTGLPSSVRKNKHLNATWKQCPHAILINVHSANRVTPSLLIMDFIHWWKLIRESCNSKLIVVRCLSRKPTMVIALVITVPQLFALFPVSLNHWPCLNRCPWLQSIKAVSPPVLIDCMCEFQKLFITQMRQKGVC
jgi:hypothetical protein